MSFWEIDVLYKESVMVKNFDFEIILNSSQSQTLTLFLRDVGLEYKQDMFVSFVLFHVLLQYP
ncbi:hypothetical protein BpHYR1_040363 [Brachionus plicatilis]|uniref:Uncharacterized protein n=1 Tax=Brachionus plicatilis TaxID=10195 RepID=A0A3M7QX15_BRAPC|nr:hypothetical protein BpHYR1_040363 [Brachionus plicatilis]